jgi:hypothetical protein
MLLLALEDRVRGESYAGCDGAHCCGVVGCLFVVVGLLDSICVDAIDGVGRWIG